MKDLQDVFNRIRETKREQKAVRALYKDALESSGEYREVKDKLEELKARKQQLEASAWEEVGGRDKIEALQNDIKLDQELLSDIALSTLMKGETVKVTDENENEYEPIFAVRFKKANEVRQ